MKTDDWKEKAQKVRKVVLNKYTITCAVFAVLLTFCGEHSLVKRAQNAKQVRAMKTELEGYQTEIEQHRKAIQHIQGKPDQIEKFAREKYYMHADNETVFVIEEDE